MSDDLAFADAVTLAARVRDRSVSPVELVRAYLDRIDRLDGRLRAYITVCGEPRSRRRAAPRRRWRGAICSGRSTACPSR